MAHLVCRDSAFVLKFQAALKYQVIKGVSMEARETIATVGEMTVAQLKAIIFLERIAVNGLLERIKRIFGTD
jgi:hypothetical protein